MAVHVLAYLFIYSIIFVDLVLGLLGQHSVTGIVCQMGATRGSVVKILHHTFPFGITHNKK
jgi:hypothetical protein